MFTLGIFTTHIPYIALVVFYAFFWIVGVNKAISGEIQSAEKSIITGFNADNYIYETDQNIVNDSHEFTCQNFVTADYNFAFAVLRKLKFKDYHFDKQQQSYLNNNLFSRPPPFLS